METILGIDLGTTNSEVAIIQDNQVHVIEEDGEAILPSVVGLDEQGRFLVGTPARNQWVLAPERTVRSIKRKMGQAETVRLGDQAYTPQEISAIILRTLKERAERHLGRPIRKAVITVPAFFNETQREATREAGELAGLEVVRIINEPTAASLTYDPHPEKMERLLVYDLGGGTFDVSVVQIEQGVVEVLASHGDTHLGGDDFDELLLDYVCGKFLEKHQIELRQSLRSKSRMLHAVEAAKRALSDEAVVTIQEEFIAEKGGSQLHLREEIARPEYERLIEPLLAKTLECVDQSLADAKLNARQIDKVILVGGATRTPMVRRLLEEQLGQPVHAEVNPDLCVAMGAAIQGGLIAGIDVGPVLVDITPHTLGVEVLAVMGSYSAPYFFSRLIHRNTPLPASHTEIYGTVVDGQKRADISVYQGEDDDVRHNQLVGEFLLEGLADVRRGNEVLVRFDLDLDGILKVTASERTTGLQKQLTIDNPVTRFRARNRQDAMARVAATFLGEPASTGAPPVERDRAEASAATDAHSGLPPHMRPIIERCEKLISQGERISPEANPQDAAEIRRLIERLRGALARADQQEIEAAAAQLEDLVFYLQDV